MGNCLKFGKTTGYYRKLGTMQITGIKGAKASIKILSFCGIGQLRSHHYWALVVGLWFGILFVHILVICRLFKMHWIKQWSVELPSSLHIVCPQYRTLTSSLSYRVEKLQRWAHIKSCLLTWVHTTNSTKLKLQVNLERWRAISEGVLWIILLYPY